MSVTACNCFVLPSIGCFIILYYTGWLLMLFEIFIGYLVYWICYQSRRLCPLTSKSVKLNFALIMIGYLWNHQSPRLWCINLCYKKAKHKLTKKLGRNEWRLFVQLTLTNNSSICLIYGTYSFSFINICFVSLTFSCLLVCAI